MPTFRVTGPDGKIYNVTAPDGATQDQVLARVKAQAGQVRPGISGSKWTPTGLALDKITAGIYGNAAPLVDTVVDKVQGDSRPFGELFNAHQRDQDRTRGAYQTKNPGVDWATFPLNFIGGPRAVKGILSIGQLAKTGAKIGAVAGAANSRGGAWDRAWQTALSTGGGALLTPVASKAVSSLTPIIAATAKRGPKLSPVNKIIKKTLEAQGMTPRQAGDMISEAQNRGVPLALMDTGDEMRGLTASLARKPGPNRNLIRDVVVPRQQAQAERIQGALARDLGPTANIRQQSEALIASARAKAGPLYEQAYASPVVGTPKMDELLATPFGKQAVARARTIAANERRDPQALGFTLDAKGDVVLNPVPVREIDQLDAAREGWDAANAAYEAAVRKQQASLNPSQFSREVEQAQSALQAANAGLDKAKQVFASAPASGTVKDARGYSPQTLDYIKRGMDDVIEAQRNPVTGRLNLDEAGRAQNDVLRNFLAEVDRVNPAYAEARAAYSGPASMAGALNKGSKAATKDAETLWAETRDLNPSQLEQYRLGARTGLSNLLDARVDNADKVRALIGTPKKREALNQVFGESGGLDNFLATLGDEGAASQTYQRAFTGSPTALNLADDANLDGLTGVAVNAGGRALGGQGLFRNGISTMADIARYGLGKKAEGVRSSLAGLLTETDPKVTASVFDEIIKQRMLTEVANTRATALADPLSRIGGYGGGQAFGRFLPYLEEQ